MSATTATVSSNRVMHALIASAIGSALEWYDFFIYGTASALVFGELFFPKYDTTIGTLAAYATFAVGFIARPFGGLFFGHFGDRSGPQADAGHHAAAGRRRHVSDRPAADLRLDRHLGAACCCC